ncbi:MAG: PIN domain-containing protein [Pseudomonadota bacterium]|nr:PIN domain-containing protein [Pseudomonadota bacterium]
MTEEAQRGDGPPRAFLDACVLFPPLTRGLLLSAAVEGLLDPAWSPGVVAEWAHATARDHGPLAAEAVHREAAMMARRWPSGLAEPAPDAAEALSLPDAGDRHVLAAALEARAALLVTANLRDFPAPKLRPLGLAPIHPDALLWELAGRAPEAMARALARTLETFPALQGDRAETVRALKRAGLPRFAKVLKTGGLDPA